MCDASCDECADKRQLEWMQSVGGVGYWEYDAVTRSMALPPASIALLRKLAGGASESFGSLLDAVPAAERERFQATLDQAVTRHIAFDTELRLPNGTPRGAQVLVRGVPVTEPGSSLLAGTFQDISAGKRTEEQLTRQRDVMKTIIDNFPGAISLFDADLRMAACNAQFKTLLDLPESLFAKNEVHFEELIRFNAQRGEYGPGDVDTLTAASLERARNFKAHHMERARPDGKWLEITGTPIPSGGFVTSYIDITERKKVEERIRVLALQDGLTGLPNRLSLNEQLEQALERAAAAHQGFAVLFIDLDGFKEVNDNRGHDVGDALLVQVAQTLKDSVRQSDIVARLGGDEFVVLLNGASTRATVAALADKMVRGLGQPCVVMGAPVQIGASIGIALYPDHGDSREGLLKAADQAMYLVKTHGKSGYRFSAAGG